MQRLVLWLLLGIVSLALPWYMDTRLARALTTLLNERVSVGSASLYPGFTLLASEVTHQGTTWRLEAPTVETGIRWSALVDGSPLVYVNLHSPALELSFQKERIPRKQGKPGQSQPFRYLVELHDGVVRASTPDHDIVVAGCSGTFLGRREISFKGSTFAYKGRLGSWTGSGPVVVLRNLELRSIRVNSVTGTSRWTPSMNVDLSMKFTGPVMDAEVKSAFSGNTVHATMRVSLEEPRGNATVEYRGTLGALAQYPIPHLKHLLSHVDGSGMVRVSVLGRRDNWSASALFRLDSLTVNHPIVAPGPVEFRNIEGNGELSFQKERINGSLALFSPMKLKVSFRHDAREEYADLDIPVQPCSAPLEALSSLLGPLASMKIKGKMGWHASLWRKSGDWDSLQGSLRTMGPGCRVVKDVKGFDPHGLAGAVRLTLVDSFGRKTERDLSPGSSQFYPLARVPSWVVGAFLAAEDRRFFQHNGFDWPMLVRAVARNMAAGKIVKGGSTITNQLVKNVYLSPRRTLERKLKEALLTWRVEQVLSKRRILELYLNIIEMAPGRRGIKEGSLLYFRKLPSRLSPIEACHLALITRAPTFYFNYFKKGIVPDSWMKKVRALLRKVYEIGSIDRKKYLEEKVKPIVIQDLTR